MTEHSNEDQLLLGSRLMICKTGSSDISKIWPVAFISVFLFSLSQATCDGGCTNQRSGDTLNSLGKRELQVRCRSKCEC